MFYILNVCLICNIMMLTIKKYIHNNNNNNNNNNIDNYGKSYCNNVENM